MDTLFSLSHSVWSAWIEIDPPELRGYLVGGRTPYGVRGLKYVEQPLLICAYVSHSVWSAGISFTKYVL
ncbi:hypothetical protein SAMN05428987_5013 [Paenibacillus sp. CF095]|nr:hypothetical protein SAMN05428987_5013 [Paenibacillus sp. CF095]